MAISNFATSSVKGRLLCSLSLISYCQVDSVSAFSVIVMICVSKLMSDQTRFNSSPRRIPVARASRARKTIFFSMVLMGFTSKMKEGAPGLYVYGSAVQPCLLPASSTEKQKVYKLHGIITLWELEFRRHHESHFDRPTVPVGDGLCTVFL